MFEMEPFALQLLVYGLYFFFNPIDITAK